MRKVKLLFMILLIACLLSGLAVWEDSLCKRQTSPKRKHQAR